MNTSWVLLRLFKNARVLVVMHSICSIKDDIIAVIIYQVFAKFQPAL
jgi:hypothetical protein